jgi:hypothetical protein
MPWEARPRLGMACRGLGRACPGLGQAIPRRGLVSPSPGLRIQAVGKLSQAVGLLAQARDGEPRPWASFPTPWDCLPRRGLACPGLGQGFQRAGNACHAVGWPSQGPARFAGPGLLSSPAPGTDGSSLQAGVQRGKGGSPHGPAPVAFLSSWRFSDRLTVVYESPVRADPPLGVALCWQSCTLLELCPPPRCRSGKRGGALSTPSLTRSGAALRAGPCAARRPGAPSRRRASPCASRASP